MRLLTLIILTTLFATPAFAQDRRGTGEMPLFGRYEGSRIADQARKEFDRVDLSTPGQGSGTLSVEGRRVWTVLQGPKGRSGLEVFLNYQRAAASLGFKTLYTCSRAKCRSTLFTDGLGGSQSEVVYAMAVAGDGSIEDSHYLVAQRTGPTGTDTLRLAVRGPALPVALVDLIQSAPLEIRVSVKDAQSIASDVQQSGKSLLYALFFDTDSAALNPDSKPQMEALAAYLRGNPRVSVFVVGHTDGSASVAHNQDLSQRRAAAVVAALVRDYAIATPRVEAYGVGELAPVASNETPQGRTENRRVEIIKRID